jgi:hypothetical protein
MPGAGLGELDAQLLQQQGHLVVDVLGAVVRMKSQDHKRKLLQQLPDDRQQRGLADLLTRGNELKLGHAVHRVDVIDPLPAILITLVHTVDADIARPPIRLGARRWPMGTPVGRVLVQCRRVRWYWVLPRRLYRWETEIPASRSKRASLNTRKARSINFFVHRKAIC